MKHTQNIFHEIFLNQNFTYEQKILAASTITVVCTLALLPYLPGLISKLRIPKFKCFRGIKKGIYIAGEFLDDAARLRQTHITGATGTGKTVLLEHLIFQDIARGQGALIIDPKGDRELYDRVKAFCEKIGRGADLHYLSANFKDESVCWNPCRLGNPSELQSKFYNASTYSEPHYAKACELALLEAFNELAKSDEPITLKELSKEISKESKNSRDNITAGLSLDLNNMSSGDWGEILGVNGSQGRKEISLLDITRKNEILFVDLPTEAQAVQSSRVGKLLLQEIILISGLRKIYPHVKSDKPFSVFVDEFDAFASESFATYLNKGRSSDFMIHLAHQTLSDLKKVSDTFLGQIMGNMNVRFVFRQDLPEDAETWSMFFGTHKIVKKTFQTQDGQNTGMSSNREAQEFRISPDTIKELKTGECIFSVKTTQMCMKLKIPLNTTARLVKKRPIERPKLPSKLSNRPSAQDLVEHCNSLASLVESTKSNNKQGKENEIL